MEKHLLERTLTIVFTVITMVVILVPQSVATEAVTIRASSEADKTRIVVELDAAARYQVQHTSDQDISICLLETGIGHISTTPTISDELVDAVSLKEIVGNIVDINISLKRPASFAVFPLESPDRIVIDIMPAEETRSDQLTALSVSGMVPKDADNPAPVSEDVARSTLSLKGIYHPSVQLCLNALLIIALAIIAVKLRQVCRSARSRNSDASISSAPLKKNRTFADMIDELGQEMPKKGVAKVSDRILPAIDGNRQRRRKAGLQHSQQESNTRKSINWPDSEWIASRYLSRAMFQSGRSTLFWICQERGHRTNRTSTQTQWIL